jgi:hypothetical protein
MECIYYNIYLRYNTRMKIFNMTRPSVSRQLREDNFKTHCSECNPPMVRIKTMRRSSVNKSRFFFRIIFTQFICTTDAYFRNNLKVWCFGCAGYTDGLLLNHSTRYSRWSPWTRATSRAFHDPSNLPTYSYLKFPLAQSVIILLRSIFIPYISPATTLVDH